ncbi:MAG: hypothetical protein Q9201_004731 [Fulgogasparrea decipioides]
MVSEIRHSIEKADIRFKNLKAPLNVVLSGSLGRIMAQDPELCYVVSTCAALAPLYGASDVTDIICTLMLNKRDSSDKPDMGYGYDVRRMPITAVMSKIIESVFLNVVNAGHKMDSIPEELCHLHIHLLDHTTFAAIIADLQHRKGDVLIVSRCFLGDLAAWL